MSKDSSPPENFVTLKDERSGKSTRLPVIHGTQGAPVLDISKLHAELGYYTYDPSFGATGSCASEITFVDGNEGILMHRGYEIGELAEKSDYLEVCYLLLNENLPNKKQKEEFCQVIRNHTMLHDQMQYFFRGFRRDAHPMAIMVAVVGALSAFYHDSLDIHDDEQRKLASIRMIAKMPTIAAQVYKYAIGQPFVSPCNDLGYVENFLKMTFSVPAEDYKADPAVVRALEQIFILHADHEQNASTSTVRLAGSSGANPFACIAAGISSLWGPAHGGANEAVLKMLEDMEETSRIPEFLARAKDKDDPFRLMGFGHRVYKNYDPRAAVLRKCTEGVLNSMGVEREPLFERARALEKMALEDAYFVERKLFPNVDFYSGILLRAMGFPTSMFTVLFALARTVGWVAQWREMVEDPSSRIGRPRQLYRGKTKRPFVALEKR